MSLLNKLFHTFLGLHEEYKCTIRRSVKFPDLKRSVLPENEIIFEHSITIPFPPIPGIQINHDNIKPPVKTRFGVDVAGIFDSGKLEQVIWLPDGQRFVCIAEAVELQGNEILNEVIEDFIHNGWVPGMGFTGRIKEDLKEHLGAMRVQKATS